MIGCHFAPRRDNLRLADAMCAGPFIWSSGIMSRRIWSSGIVLRRRFDPIHPGAAASLFGVWHGALHGGKVLKGS
jgi:hypothetical protein